MAFRRTTTAIIASGVAFTGGLVGCGSSSDTGDVTTPLKVVITEKDGRISPSGDVVRAETGQDITFVINSDADDEIHVHTEPDHEFRVHAAKRLVESFSVDTPGTYEVESHRLDVVVVKLEVS